MRHGPRLRETVIPVAGGANNGSTKVSLKSVYSGDSVYFLATWDDPTQSFIRSPWEKQADGTWKMMGDPNDKGGDNNKLYEDKFSTHLADQQHHQGLRYRRLHGPVPCRRELRQEAVRQQVHRRSRPDGRHLALEVGAQRGPDRRPVPDNTRYSADTPEAGRKSDAKESGGYADNMTADKKLPTFMAANGGSKDGAPGFILDAEKVAFDDKMFKAGDRVPAIVVAPIKGDRGDIAAGWKYANGKWTLEFGRKLTTGSKTDVQFDKLDASYPFALAAFDNAQVRHAFQAGATPSSSPLRAQRWPSKPPSPQRLHRRVRWSRWQPRRCRRWMARVTMRRGPLRPRW